jgi:hypothetical protein
VQRADFNTDCTGHLVEISSDTWALRDRYHQRLHSARSSALLVEVTGRKRDQRFVAPEIIRVSHGE